ncbi:MAG TPA: tRNA preQ1(34) S-adenosylmethionine ribosyltransferase-isomerase QueA [Elusimicrobia bacterium]|nr:tRNA preQ1(34) S-adenosylmethionine ribosyltransferase-isomerase QueA [Elusimicrobiota bacterium]HBT62496.1 tRNA preQ1(34) S-adenosylmethionine ribosyltransferase-isomerase QueA [Elusimicrobiota bacterium]
MKTDTSPLPLSDFDFDFPEELVAAAPAEPRDSARLLSMERSSGALRHLHFRDLASCLNPGDCLVLNETKVLSCRLVGRKTTGGRAELLLVAQIEPGLWSALASGLKPGMRLDFPGGAAALVEDLSPEGEYLCRFNRLDIGSYLAEHGHAPLPPYILKRKRPPDPADRTRYQTVYARETGSIAAPTAGLHFTPKLLEELAASGVRVARVTLHVGRGTFRPITSLDARGHAMLPEHYRMSAEDAQVVSQARREGGRVIAVGTTSTRTLESLARRPEGFGPGEGWTNLYICPGHDFRIVTSLITNFHLPKSTPLLLAAAFIGRERLLAAYQEAFRQRYRLYSYGDAMGIF